MGRFWVVSGTMLALAGAGGYLAWRPTSGGAADAPYRTGTVDRGAITASVRATGTLNPVTTVLVGSQLSGQVVEIRADYNSTVKAGQVVARIYSEQIKARRDAARADVEQARADLGMRRAQVDRARATRQKTEANVRDITAQRDRVTAQLNDAKRTLDRQTELLARNVGAQTALDTARTQTEIQKATLASSEAQIASMQAEMKGLDADAALAEAQVKSAEALILQREAKLREIELDLERTEIKSPVDGVVVKRDIELGQTVAASLNAPTLFQVAQDLQRIDIHANIDEADVGRIKADQPVTFTVNAYPNRTFTGRVRLVRLGAQTVQNVVTYTAVIGVDNRDLSLLPGLTANLQIVTDERPDALRVANAALRFRPPGALPPAPGAAPFAAVAAPQGPSPRGGARPLEALRERIAAEVQPTPEQAAAIDRVLAEARTGTPPREAGLSDEERRAGFRAARRDLNAKIAAVLDPDRRAKFEATLAERRPRSASGRGDGARAEAEGTPGRVFVLDAAGKPTPMTVSLGVTDGAFTEIVAGELRDGDAVVVGGGPKTAQNPVSPQETSPAQRPRGGPRLF